MKIEAKDKNEKVSQRSPTISTPKARVTRRAHVAARVCRLGWNVHLKNCASEYPLAV